MTAIELKGGAEIFGGEWCFKNGCQFIGIEPFSVYINICVGEVDATNIEVELTSDTARSMASALNHFADQADKYKERE